MRFAQRVRDCRPRTNIGNVTTGDDAIAALNQSEWTSGQTIIPLSSVNHQTDKQD